MRKFSWVALLTVLWAGAALAQANKYVETEVTTAGVPDFELDSAFEGVQCPSCNHGFGNSRIVFTDSQGNLWLAGIDYQTGHFIPSDARGTLIDTNTAPVPDFGNGPEWIYSSTFGSQIIYIKYLDGQPHSLATATVAVKSQMPDGSWVGGTLPNAIGRATGFGMRDPAETDPRINYIASDKKGIYWRQMSRPDVENVIPISDMTKGNGRRWVPGKHAICIPAKPRGSVVHSVAQQVFTYDFDSGALTQLTNEPLGVVGCYMWKAPDYNNETLFVTMPTFRQQIYIYRQLTGPDGQKQWTILKKINPPAKLPFFFSPAPFVHNGKSYVVFQLSPSSKFFDKTIPTHIGFASIDPLGDSQAIVLTNGGPPRLRLDPKKVFMTAKGPFVYYNRAYPQTATHSAINDGTWYVDMQLGPPLK